ncbi:MAG: FeoA domain-containing protein [Myxococcota bacterium]|nr:FeoA domain-containing protein [Myxococcota bacterium]
MHAPEDSAPSQLTLDAIPLQQQVVVQSVAGERGFRRRLLELGLLPGTPVSVVRVAPLGDPLELSLRGSRLSIRRFEASQIRVVPA